LGRTFLIATFTQGIFYGVYMTTLAHSLRWLLFEDEGWKAQPRRRVNWPMLAVTLILFVFATVDLGVTLRITFALVSGETLISKKLELLSITVENTTILITDAVLMYRTWLVYTKSWRAIVLPSMLWSTGITCVILFDYWLIKDLGASSQLSLVTVFTPRTRRIAAVFFCCSLVNNLYATCAISYRILRVARTSRSTSLYITCRVFAESGILCASTTTLMLITSAVMDGENLVEILLDVVNFSMMGIAFNLILIRVGKQRARQEYHEGTLDSAPKTVRSVETEGTLVTDTH